MAYADESCSHVDSVALSAGTCFFTDSGTEIGSFEESCGGNADSSSNSTDSAATTTMSTSIDENRDNKTAAPTAAASAASGESAFPTAATTSGGPESESVMPTSPRLQATPTSDAKSFAGDRKCAEAAIPVLMAIGGLEVIWGVM